MRVRILTTLALLAITVACAWLAGLVGGVVHAFFFILALTSGLILIFMAFLVVADLLSLLNKPAEEEDNPGTSGTPHAISGGGTPGLTRPNGAPGRRRAA